MEQYKPNESEFIHSLKKLVVGMLFKSNIIPNELKPQVRRELENIDSDDWWEFATKERLAEFAASYSVGQWVKQNLELAELWKSVAISNASHNNQPTTVADEVLSAFKQEFTI